MKTTDTESCQPATMYNCTVVSLGELNCHRLIWDCYSTTCLQMYLPLLDTTRRYLGGSSELVSAYVLKGVFI